MKVLVIVAHPDDEVIGAGGTIRKFANAGAKIRLVVFSAGAEGYTTAREKTTIVKQRAKELKEVCRILGIQEFFNEGWLDFDFRTGNKGYHTVIGHIRQFKPDLVITHRFGDYNDHKVSHDTVTDAWYHAAIPCVMNEGPIWKHVPLYEFEAVQLHAEPQIVVDITDTYQVKVKAMQAYGSQLNLVGGVNQLMEGRALARGWLIGVKYGEAFRRVTYYRPRPISDVRQLQD